MFNRNDIVLIDTNVIIEAHRVNCWNALAEYYNLHTVEKVVEETQTGFQNRRYEETIDQNVLQQGLQHIESISELQVIKFDIDNPGNSLDPGEKHLLIYAHTLQQNAWLLNSPDRAAVKYVCSNKWNDRLVSLEAMNNHLKVRSQGTLKSNFSDDWLSQAKLPFLF